VKVVITGGAGFIGSNLARYWATHRPEDEVVVYDALTYAGRRESLADLEKDGRIDFERGNIGDPARLKAILPGADLVLHLAAESHNDRGIASPMRFVETNVLGTATLLEACRAHDVGRFHHVSTDEVFGSLALDDPQKFTESTAYDPRGPYSASKAGSDHLVRAWATTYGLKVTISNCGNNFGPYQFPEKLIPLAVTSLVLGKKVPLYGDGKNVRDWIYVADHCSAIETIVNRGTPGSTYLVSAGNELPNLEILSRILKVMGRGPESIEYVKDRAGHDRRYALDSTRLRSELGWAPAFSFDEALTGTVQWYLENRGWWEPLLKHVG
jgi:dTDP-glucose 4,6-dehydratase